MSALNTNASQNAEVAERWPREDRPYDVHHLMSDFSRDRLLRLADDEDLMGLVEKENGSIVGYIHRDHAERIAAVLNYAHLKIRP